MPSLRIVEALNDRPLARDSSFVLIAVSVVWVSTARATGRQKSNKGVNPKRIAALCKPEDKNVFVHGCRTNITIQS